MNGTIQIRNLVDLPVLTDVDTETVRLVAAELRLFADTLDEVGRPVPTEYESDFDALFNSLTTDSVSRVRLQLTEPGQSPEIDDGWESAQSIALYFKETDMVFTDVLRSSLEITDSVAQKLSSQYQQGIQFNNTYREWSQVATFLDIWIDLTTQKAGVIHLIYGR